jgi:hypothetical protein
MDFHYRDGNPISTEEAAGDVIAPFAMKFNWFFQHGYYPHPFQIVFHGNRDGDLLTRFRHLAAGRRGGKTLCAAQEVVYYCLNPREFHHDAHGIDLDRPLDVWVVTRDYPLGTAALRAFRDALRTAGAEHGREYKEHKGNRWIEFENGTFLQFKTADDPESLRGAGLDILWIDEAAIIPDERAWETVRSAIADKRGIVITTTTPQGKNWYFDEFWIKHASNPNHGHIEYRSIDNPYFSAEEWIELKRDMHPMVFKREHMAAFDSMAGKELSGDWLKYYEIGDTVGKELDTFLGVDPAISLSDTADRFVITLIGKSKDNTQVYLLKQWAGRIPFPEQVNMIYSWWLDSSPWPRPKVIGIERTAYQAALEQQVARLEGLPPTIKIPAKGKKSERILAMSPSLQAW